jgi:hypothetical protein
VNTGIRIAVEILSSVIIGILSSFIIQDPYVDLAIGIMVFLVIEVVRMGMTVDSIDHSVKLLAEVIRSFQRPARNSLDSYFNTLLLAQLNKGLQGSGPHRIKVPASEGHSFWLRLFPYTETNYLATSHTPYEEGWERGFSDKGMVLHKSKIDDGVQINRVFVVKDAAEYKSLREVIQFQKDIGISVRYIELDTIKKIRVLHKNLQRFGTYDFAILDGTHVFKVLLNRNREWTSIELWDDSDSLALAKQIYEDIWEEATPA